MLWKIYVVKQEVVVQVTKDKLLVNISNYIVLIVQKDVLINIKKSTITPWNKSNGDSYFSHKYIKYMINVKLIIHVQ